MQRPWVAIAVAALLMAAGCSSRQGEALSPAETTKVTISTPGGMRQFDVELADTAEAQARGLMYRTNLPIDGGMLFAPYPPDGGPPRRAQFWMKDTPSPLDILFIRADHRIARIVENAAPFSEAPIDSGEPVAAVLEIRGGRVAELGIGEGDMVNWQPPRR